MNYRIDKEEIWNKNKLESTRYVIKYVKDKGAFKGWRSLKYNCRDIFGSYNRTLYFNNFNEAEDTLKKILEGKSIESFSNIGNLEFQKV